jgi:uncharacterized repeat protein (TIGR01451 family)
MLTACLLLLGCAGTSSQSSTSPATDETLEHAGGYDLGDETPVINMAEQPARRLPDSDDVPIVAATPDEDIPVAEPRRVLRSGSAAGFGNLLSIETGGPNTVNLNEVFESVTTLRAIENCARITVRQRIPEGVTIVKSEPEAEEEDGLLVWRYPWMDPGSEQTITVWLKAAQEGAFVPCASVEAYPRSCYTVTVTRAQIAITKSGPTQATLNETFSYRIVVENVGNGTARDVVVYDELPSGLTHESGSRSLTFQVGDLAPGESKTIAVTVTAQERGEHVNKAVAESSNADAVNAQASTLVLYKDFKVFKSGPSQQFLNRRARYDIVVTNLGDAAITDIQVVDAAPTPTRILTAEGAETQTERRAVWNIARLEGGAARQFTVTLTTSTPGTHVNKVVAVADDGTRRSAEAATLWKGMPAMLLEVVDTEDPLMVGEETVYIIKVTNQGTAADGNVQIVAKFPRNITPVAGTGATAGTIENNVVTFEPRRSLDAKESITYRIRAKGVEIGDARVKVYLTSDLLQTSVPEEESTHVY